MSGAVARRQRDDMPPVRPASSPLVMTRAPAPARTRARCAGPPERPELMCVNLVASPWRTPVTVAHVVGQRERRRRDTPPTPGCANSTELCCASVACGPEPNTSERATTKKRSAIAARACGDGMAWRRSTLRRPEIDAARAARGSAAAGGVASRSGAVGAHLTSPLQSCKAATSACPRLIPPSFAGDLLIGARKRPRWRNSTCRAGSGARSSGSPPPPLKAIRSTRSAPTRTQAFTCPRARLSLKDGRRAPPRPRLLHAPG